MIKYFGCPFWPPEAHFCVQLYKYTQINTYLKIKTQEDKKIHVCEMSHESSSLHSRKTKSKNIFYLNFIQTFTYLKTTDSDAVVTSRAKMLPPLKNLHLQSSKSTYFDVNFVDEI